MRNSMLAGEYTLYFEWLINKVGGEDWWDEYTESLIRLFERSYYYENVIDSACAMRGKDLRTEAIIDGIPAIAIPNGEASVLEVLISLAIRVNDELLPSDDEEDRSAKYFDDILEVLGMKVSEDYIDNAIDRFLAGKSQITRRRKLRPFEATLWQQANMFFYDQFKIETDDA